TIGISQIIQNLLTIIYGSQRRSFPALFDFGMISIGSIQIHYTQLMMCVVSLILLLVLTAIIEKTKIGLAMRATEQNTKAASLMGINVNFVFSVTFFLTGDCGGSAGQ
ncbi:ABC transporter permease subunit, partial [Anaerotruncus colihominis]|uniref:ABC transporter permease subunit n=1 Tax=Anaerotruncus colihominis TaxID=169435 RepID=UPI0038442DAA|nr:branched-chain amino acid ABC transporter permease [Anaerotruncus colihominis]